MQDGRSIRGRVEGAHKCQTTQAEHRIGQTIEGKNAEFHETTSCHIE